MKKKTKTADPLAASEDSGPTWGKATLQAERERRKAQRGAARADLGSLEAAALAAHRDGQRWADFLIEHGDAIRQAEPHDPARYRRLHARLLHLVVSGERSGQFPAGDDEAAPWEADDQPGPDDCHTTANVSNARNLPWLPGGEQRAS